MEEVACMKKMTYQEIIDTYEECIFSPVGNSMLPLIQEGLDTVQLIKVSRKLKKNDVILYLRADGRYVLHRIVRVHKNGFDLLGDNQVAIERNVQQSQVIALLVGIYKKEKYLPTTSFLYRFYVKKQFWVRVMRSIKISIKKCIKK